MRKDNTIKIYKYIFGFSCLCFVVSLSFQVYTANTTALKGKDFVELYETKQEIEREIAYLQYENSTLSSLSFVENKAKQMGFEPMKEALLTIGTPPLALVN